MQTEEPEGTPPPKVTETKTTLKPGAVKREPIQVRVVVSRSGGSVMLRITGIGRGHEEGEPFEDPTKWSVSASAAGEELKRVLNGPVRLERIPVGHASGSQWNVFVRFSVAFKLESEARKVDVTIEPPEAPTFRKRYDVSQ